MEDDPPKKRCKLSLFTIKCILPDDCTNNILLGEVYISIIDRKQFISRIMEQLTQHLPLPGKLQHIKRVRQNEIVLCEVESVKQSNLSIDEYLRSLNISEDVVGLINGNISVAKIPFTSPKLRSQYEVTRPLWPCKFHPDKYLERLYDGSVFNENDQIFHQSIFKLLLDISTELENNKPCGACVDPRSRSIVALSTNCVDQHPFMHAPMVLIDLVARTQNPKVYRSYASFDFVEEPNIERNTSQANLSGISKGYHDFISGNPNYSNLRLGAENLRISSERFITNGNQDICCDNLNKYGPYLCTGYDVYLLQEPCLMCSFALLHSRTRRIFFANASKDNGTLMSCYKLHNVKELNHHYEVFHCEVQSIE